MTEGEEATAEGTEGKGVTPRVHEHTRIPQKHQLAFLSLGITTATIDKQRSLPVICAAWVIYFYTITNSSCSSLFQHTLGKHTLFILQVVGSYQSDIICLDSSFHFFSS